MSQVTNNIKLEIGQKYGRLTAIECKHVIDNRKRVLWLFRCDCGNEVNVSASDVRLGRKQSCGCLGREHKKNCGNRLGLFNLKPNKEGPTNKLFGTYKRHSIRRGYEWNLSKEEFRTLIEQDCFYCGRHPSSQFTTSSKNKVIENVLLYNGVDRKNNLKGYNWENCITACGVCNRMKMDLPYEEYMQTIKFIYERHFRIA